MKNKLTPPKFFAYVKDFNTGKLHSIDVLEYVLPDLERKYKPRRFHLANFTKEEINKELYDLLHYHFWSKCECEFIVVDWPFGENSLVSEARPVKVDVWDQLSANYDLILDLVYIYIVAYNIAPTTRIIRKHQV